MGKESGNSAEWSGFLLMPALNACQRISVPSREPGSKFNMSSSHFSLSLHLFLRVSLSLAIFQAVAFLSRICIFAVFLPLRVHRMWNPKYIYIFSAPVCPNSCFFCLYEYVCVCVSVFSCFVVWNLTPVFVAFLPWLQFGTIIDSA